MQRKRQLWIGSLSSLALIILILDSQTALAGAKEGIELCICTVVPSLFPFFVLTTRISSTFVGHRIPILRPLGKLCGIPEGGESILLLGLIGGYPVGAQTITDAYRSKKIDKHTAERLLGFCSNAGPAFIFGMVSARFASPVIAWVLWGIHILSALIVGILLPGKKSAACNLEPTEPITLPQALERSIKIMGSVCGWVILFRVIAAFCDRWFLWLLPKGVQVGITGLLELSNGCWALNEISSEAVRFLLSSCMLAFGGICVGMQTVSVTKGLGTGMYFPGKVMQSLISFLLAAITQRFLYPLNRLLLWTPAVAVLLIICVFFVLLKQSRKKVVALCG